MRIEVCSATLRFGEREVFTNFSAQFNPGGVTVLVGPSGSGKSSLLAVMSGYLKLESGAVEYVSNGNRMPPDPSMVVWASQGSNALARRSVLDNAMIGPLSGGASMRDSVQLAMQFLDMVGLNSRMRAQVHELSGGELQRLSLARALAAGREAIFADEPSANLDEKNTTSIAQLLAKISTASVVVVATHDPVLISAATSVVSLRESSDLG